MTEKRTLAPIIVLLLATTLPACYAKHFPTGEPPVPPQVAVQPVEFAVGVTKWVDNGKNNAARINQCDVVELFAKRLNAENLFTTVLFPYTGLSPSYPDVILEVSVSSNYNLHSGENLLKGVAIGLSLLLLQPALPTEYDLSVLLAVRATSRDGRLIKLYEYRSDYRFQYTLLQPSGEAINRWHGDTIIHAVEAVISQIKHDRSFLLEVAEGNKSGESTSLDTLFGGSHSR